MRWTDGRSERTISGMRISFGRRRGGPLVAGIAGLVIAGWLGPRTLLEAREVSSWPTVPGEVQSAHVERRSGRRSSSTSWYAVIRYSYEVDEGLHESERWDVTGPRKASGKSAAEETIREYAPGTRVEVFYDPTDPAQAVLEEGGELHGWLLVAFGLGLLGYAGIGVRRRLREGRL